MSGISLNTTTILMAVTIAEFLVVLFFAARWYSRRWGWRSTFGRVTHYFRAVLSDLAEPVIKIYRFGRDVRVLAAQLSSPELGETLRWATDDSRDSLRTDPQARCFAVQVSTRQVAVAVAAPTRPPTPPGWTEQEGWWWASRRRTPAPPRSRQDAYVAVGINEETAVLLDLDQAPGVVEILGPPRVVSSLICGIAAQFAGRLSGDDRTEVIIAAGVHPKVRGQELTSILTALARRPVGADGSRTVLLCGRLEPAQAAALRVLTATDPTIRVFTAGPYPGRRWKLPITDAGHLVAPPLRLFADVTPLERAVARALRLRARRHQPADTALAQTTRVHPAQPSTLEPRPPAAEPQSDSSAPRSNVPAQPMAFPAASAPTTSATQPVVDPVAAAGKPISTATDAMPTMAASPDAAGSDRNRSTGSPTPRPDFGDSDPETGPSPATAGAPGRAPVGLPASGRHAARPHEVPPVRSTQTFAGSSVWDLDEPEPAADGLTGQSAAAARTDRT